MQGLLAQQEHLVLIHFSLVECQSRERSAAVVSIGKVFLMVMVLVVPMMLGVLPAAAEEASTTNMEIVRDKLRADKKLFVAQNMGLTDSEAKAFWPLYDRYQKDLGKIADRSITVISDYAKNYESMTDGVAKQLVDEYLAVQSDRLKVRKAYLPKFRGILPQIKVARYYQLENKIEAVMKYELAANIPLFQ